ncbi:carboxylesterase/lipase family protein [Chondrinema litorale]|uniref:carboxylesterase/lipase family protein n=1 Tax=Chondrinema litorale TaxID=2994555 RepID=UPI0025437DF1|nr:carboxylesterase family protein [Chondrinema litorale]UZR98083.1 carboxylesterase family protein [Chondrinema litorale]
MKIPKKFNNNMQANRLLFFFLSITLAFLQSCSQVSKMPDDEILVTGGKIKGSIDSVNNIISYKGIPFAAPPVGELRWKAPQPVKSWEGVKNCTAFGPSPMQNKPEPFLYWSQEFLIPESPISEDCLYLNVWTEPKKTEEKKPVLVYIYGGGFRSGGTGCPIYDGTAMAKKGLVFVSLNYRVGAFGFLAHPDLSKETDYNGSGNYGIMDMIAGLQWVKENIAAFGGDPENVTIAGQSAGAFGVNFLTSSPLAKGLFKNAIAESGGSFLHFPKDEITKEMAEQMGVNFAQNLGFKSIKELRKLPAEEILAAQGALSWPYADGYVMDKSIPETYAQGKQNDVNLLLGWNKNDLVGAQELEEKEYREMISNKFGEMSTDFYEVYPSETLEEITQAQLDMSRDQIFGAQVYEWGKLQDKTGQQPVFMYNFNRQVPGYMPDTQFGAFHSGEIVYAYDNLHTLNRPWENIDKEIAKTMSTYWANFAKTGNPNGEGLPEWKPYTASSEQVIVIDTVIQSQKLPTLDKMAFWEKYFSSVVE